MARRSGSARPPCVSSPSATTASHGARTKASEMQVQTRFTYDVASALSQGQRDNQEDAVIADFPLGGDVGFCVLADGMGGHASGDIASKIVVTEVFAELKLQCGDTDLFESNIAEILNDAAQSANDCVRQHAEANPESWGMGATLVAPVLVRDHLYWISVGDSPLFLYRDGVLIQLNEDHSMASQIDYMVEHGMMTAETGEGHPDRHCLTSVLIGGEIARIDCPARPVALRDGDIILVASDGIQFLEESEIAGLIEDRADRSSAEITRYLIRALDALADPEQDNVSLCVIKVSAQGSGSGEPADRQTPEAGLPIHVEPALAAAAMQAAPGRVTVMARSGRDGLSMFYHVKRRAERTA
ncbi:MAG: serine/threonine-protein phosphatase [Rhodobacteraceae bacterium]|nr:MAG: serine/threonine-protein phosphatase [Paracoccaceae bacterium]